MFKFMRDVTTMTGKHFMAGTIVPDGFSTPAGLAEMVKAGDIEEVGEPILVDEPTHAKTPAEKPTKKAA
jgi:hypothetical protein